MCNLSPSPYGHSPLGNGRAVISSSTASGKGLRHSFVNLKVQSSQTMLVSHCPLGKAEESLKILPPVGRQNDKATGVGNIFCKK